MTDQGKTYALFIEAELKSERERRAACDARGQAIVATSSGLVTLLAAFAALVRPTPVSKFLEVAIGPLLVALTSLAAAATFGILASWNLRYSVVSSMTLAAMVRKHWTVNETDARNFVAIGQILAIESLRKTNRRKAFFITCGLLSQLFAVMALAVTVFLVVQAA